MTAAATVFGFGVMLAFIVGFAAISYREERWMAFAVIVLIGLLIVMSMANYLTSGPPEPDWSWGA